MRKRYVAHVAALNLGLVMRTAFGYGTPRQAAAVALAILLAVLRTVTGVLMHLPEILLACSSRMTRRGRCGRPQRGQHGSRFFNGLLTRLGFPARDMLSHEGRQPP